MSFKLWVAVIVGWAVLDYLLGMLGFPYLFRLLIIGVILWNLEKILNLFGIWL